MQEAIKKIKVLHGNASDPFSKLAFATALLILESSGDNVFKEYRKTSTVKAKLFEQGDEDGMTVPENFAMLDAMENDRYGIGQPKLVPYVSTLENQKHIGEFGKHYLCIGIDGERWLVDKGIFERTYETVG